MPYIFLMITKNVKCVRVSPGYCTTIFVRTMFIY